MNFCTEETLLFNPVSTTSAGVSNCGADTRRSAVGVVIMSLVVVPWMLAYVIGQEAVFGDALFHKLDASRLNLE